MRCREAAQRRDQGRTAGRLHCFRPVLSSSPTQQTFPASVPLLRDQANPTACLLHPHRLWELSPWVPPPPVSPKAPTVGGPMPPPATIQGPLTSPGAFPLATSTSTCQSHAHSVPQSLLLHPLPPPGCPPRPCPLFYQPCFSNPLPVACPGRAGDSPGHRGRAGRLSSSPLAWTR